MTQMKIKHFAIYTNNVDSLSLNPEKYKSCLTVMLQVKLFCYSGQCIFTHLWWLYIHLIGVWLKKKEGGKPGILENEVYKGEGEG